MDCTTITLSKEELEIIYDITTTFFTVPSEDPNQFCKEAQQLSTKLPPRIREIIQEFVKQGSPESGFFIIQNL